MQTSWTVRRAGAARYPPRVQVGFLRFVTLRRNARDTRRTVRPHPRGFRTRSSLRRQPQVRRHGCAGTGKVAAVGTRTCFAQHGSTWAAPDAKHGSGGCCGRVEADGVVARTAAPTGGSGRICTGRTSLCTDSPARLGGLRARPSAASSWPSWRSCSPPRPSRRSSSPKSARRRRWCRPGSSTTPGRPWLGTCDRAPRPHAPTTDSSDTPAPFVRGGLPRTARAPPRPPPSRERQRALALARPLHGLGPRSRVRTPWLLRARRT